MSQKHTLELVSQPQDFFRELVSQSLGQIQLRPHPETEFYLVNLLHQFMTTDNLYLRDASGGFREEPLALMLKDANEQAEPQKSLLLRKLGDISLYVAGYFQESLNRKFVDLDYYIEIGGAAYQSVAVRSETKFKQTYSELACYFPSFVDVLADVSEKTTVPKSQLDLLRLYESWISTKSKRAEKKLKEAGIIPVSEAESTKKSVQ